MGSDVPVRRVPGVEARAGKFPGPSLIPALNAIQSRLGGWLPREELEALAREAQLPRYEIEGLISFYPHFRTTPPAKVSLHVCHDLSCWLRKGGRPDRRGEGALRGRHRRRTGRGVLPIRSLEQLEHDPELKVRLMAASGCRQSLHSAFLRQGTHRRDQTRLSQPTGAFEEQHSPSAGTREADDLRGKLPFIVPLDQRETCCVRSAIGGEPGPTGRQALHALRLGAVSFSRN